MFGGLTGQVDLDEQVDAAPGLADCLVDPGHERRAVDRMDDVEAGGSPARLVRLQVANEVPPDLKVGRLLDLLQSLLHFVLAEVDLPRRGGGPNMFSAKGLRDGDEADRRRVAACPSGC